MLIYQVRNLLAALAGLALVGFTAYPRTAAAFTDVFCNHPDHDGTLRDNDDITPFPAVPASEGVCSNIWGASCWKGHDWSIDGITYSQLQTRTCRVSGVARREIRLYAQGPLADYQYNYGAGGGRTATEYAAKAYLVNGTEVLAATADNAADGVWSSWFNVTSGTTASSTARVIAWVAGPG